MVRTRGSQNTGSPSRRDAERPDFESVLEENTLLRQTVAGLTAANAALVSEKAALSAKVAELEKTVSTVADGHIAQEVTNARLFASLKKLEERAAQQQLLQQQQSPTQPQQPRSQQLPQQRSQQLRDVPAPDRAARAQPQSRSHSQPAPRHADFHASNTMMHKFVTYADPTVFTSDQVHATLIEKLAVNSAAITVIRVGSSAPSAPDLPGVDGDGARTRNAVFVCSTSKFIADQAIKGNLRKLLRDSGINIYIDDYLTGAEQRERKARLREKKDMKAAGTTVAWRRATLWKLVTNGDSSEWRIVPAPAAAAAGGAAAAVAAGGGSSSGSNGGS